MSQSQVDESPAIQAVRYQREARAFARIAQAVVLAVLACASLSAQRFPGAKMCVIQNRKVKLVEVAFDPQDGSLVAVSKGKSPETVSIAYPEITTRVEYERTAHRRWKVGRLGSALFLPSKAKKHWLAVFRSEEETVLQAVELHFISASGGRFVSH